jgi:hypothetical protein
MAHLQIDPEPAPLTPTQSLSGWHRELCVELLGGGAARVFVRSVQQSSYRAAELQRGTLFLRLDPRFTDLPGCVQELQPSLTQLADTARRLQPGKDNLFQVLHHDRAAWDDVQRRVEGWARRPLR